jgi:translocator protein
MKKLPLLLVCLILTLSAGFIAGMATSGSIDGWYTTINKPSFNPPNYLFGPVWTSLYLLMGISLYLIIISAPQKEKRKALVLFVIQLVLNFLWSFIFFRFNHLLFASIEIVLMWVFIILMIIQFRKINTIAAWLNIPYLAWVSFASVLTLTIYVIN